MHASVLQREEFLVEKCNPPRMDRGRSSVDGLGLQIRL